MRRSKYSFRRVIPVSEAIEERQYLNRIQTDPTFKGVFGQSLMRILYINQQKHRRVHYKISKKIFLTLPSVIYAKKNFYLLQAIDEVIEILSCAGLIEFWHNKYIDKRFLNIRDPPFPKRLGLHHLSGCFLILSYGLGLSFAVFLGELFLSKFKRNAIKQNA